MKKLLLLLALYSYAAHAQIVTIPDPNFKNALVNEQVADLDGDGSYESDVDTNNDGEIQESEAAAVLGLNVEDRMIVSVVGLEAFVNLKVLYCNDNDLEELDVSALIDLEVIGAWDVDAMTHLDLSNNPNLISIEADSNNLLTSLNIANGNNENLVLMWADNNPNKLCIQVDDVAYANAQTCAQPIEWCKDETGTYSAECTLGITEVDPIEVFIGPNPVQEQLTIYGQELITDLVIYDLQGRSLIATQNKESIDVSALPKGMYLIRISTNRGAVARKFLKE